MPQGILLGAGSVAGAAFVPPIKGVRGFGPSFWTNFWGIAQVRNSAPSLNSITCELLSSLPRIEIAIMSCVATDERDCSSNPILRRLGVYSDASGHFIPLQELRPLHNRN